MGILIRTDGSSPSNVSLAAESGTPNTACTLIDVARSTSDCDVELSSIDDGFESLVATKNTPPLKNHVKFFPVVLAIQRRSIVKYTSKPESNMDLNDQIDRLMSNTLQIIMTLPASLSQFVSLISRCCISALGIGFVLLDLRKPSPGPLLSGHT